MNKIFSPIFLLLLLVGSSLSWTAFAHEVPYHEVVAHNHWAEIIGLIGVSAILFVFVIRKLLTSR